MWSQGVAEDYESCKNSCIRSRHSYHLGEGCDDVELGMRVGLVREGSKGSGDVVWQCRGTVQGLEACWGMFLFLAQKGQGL